MTPGIYDRMTEMDGNAAAAAAANNNNMLNIFGHWSSKSMELARPPGSRGRWS
jgi:hypothetical protein